MSKIIKLTKKYETIVDDNLFEELNKFKWFAAKDTRSDNYYACRRVHKNEKLIFNKVHIRLHQYIFYIKKQITNFRLQNIDHKDGDTFNNQYNNLRLCSTSNNLKNQKLNKRNTSGYKGVSWHKSRKKWRTVIRINKKSIDIGYFISKLDAVKAYNKAATKYYGEFARLNLL